MSDWNYFIGGSYDLTKQPHVQEPRPSPFMRVYIQPQLSVMSFDAKAMEAQLNEPVVLHAETYRLVGKVPLGPRDTAWLYVFEERR